MTARSALAAALAATCVGLAACGGGEDPPDARDFAGAWDVQLFVGDVQAHPDAVVTVARGDTFRERWVFEDCDESRCTLRRPDGGLALGDLDGVTFEFVEHVVDDTPRFSARAPASAVPRVQPAPPPGDGEDDHDEGGGAGDGACDASPARRWQVTVELDVRDGVLSGTVLRIPEELRVEVGATACFGIDLTFGLTGLPADGPAATEPG